jgi:hypothetical protein
MVGAIIILVSLILFGFLSFTDGDGIAFRLIGLVLSVSSLLMIQFNSKIIEFINGIENAMALKSTAKSKINRAFKQAAIFYTKNIENCFNFQLLKISEVNFSISALCKSVIQTVAVTLTPKLIPLPQSARA